MAGASPHTIVVSTVMAPAKSSTLGSIETWPISGNGTRVVNHEPSPLRIQEASTTPSTPPAADNINDSQIS